MSLAKLTVIGGLLVKLRTLRKERGISVERLAAESETSASNVRSLENGDSKPGVELAIRIAKYLQVPVEAIEWGAKPDDDDTAGKDDPAAA